MKKKKLLSILLCTALVFTMAVPAFAATDATPRYVVGQFDGWNEMASSDIVGVGGDCLVMNVRRTTPVSANGQAITLYTPDEVLDQTFAIQFSGRDGRPRMYNAAGYNARSQTGYSLNMNTNTYGCILWYDLGDDYRDAEIDALTKWYNGIKVYQITLPHRSSRSLTVRTLATNEQLYWDLPTGDVKQLWHCAVG